MEHDKIYYLESLFGVKSRDEFAEKLVYRNGVSSDVAILIDQSGKANISLPNDLNVLHGKLAQREIAKAFDELQFHRRLIKNPIVADTHFAVMKTLGVDVSVAENALAGARNERYPTRTLYDKFKGKLENLKFLEALDQILENAGISESCRTDIWNAFKGKVGEDGNLNRAGISAGDTTAREGLEFIGLTKEELTILSQRLGEEVLSENFYRLQYLGNQYKSPYQRRGDFQHYYHSASESDHTLRDEMYEYCRRTGDVDYALSRGNVPTQSSVAKSCEKLRVDQAVFVKDLYAYIPELKGVLRPRDLMDIDFSGSTFEQQEDQG